jgi:Ca-activated chloride channel family protein
MVLFAAMVVLALGAGTQSAPQRDARASIVLDVTRVDILLTVTDKRGNFVTNLNRGDFEVLEDNRPQKVLGVSARSELPLRLAVVLDTSNSVRDRFRFIQEAAVEFIRSVMRPRQDRAMVVSFDTLVGQVAEFSDDPDSLARAIRDLRPGGGTSLYEAIHDACRDKLAAEAPHHEFRRAIILISDGDDTQSRVTRDQALAMAQKSGVVIYAVSTNASKLETYGDKVLKYLAQETGGLAFFPFRLEDLGKSFQQLANELRHQYSIYYRPEPLKSDGRFHAISVRVKSKKDLTVRARKGYYAPRP